MFVTGPMEPGKKMKKREINMIDYEREASGLGAGPGNYSWCKHFMLNSHYFHIFTSLNIFWFIWLK